MTVMTVLQSLLIKPKPGGWKPASFKLSLSWVELKRVKVIGNKWKLYFSFVLPCCPRTQRTQPPRFLPLIRCCISTTNAITPHNQSITTSASLWRWLTVLKDLGGPNWNGSVSTLYVESNAIDATSQLMCWLLAGPLLHTHTHTLTHAYTHTHLLIVLVSSMINRQVLCLQTNTLQDDFDSSHFS